MSNSGFTFRRVRDEMIENLLEMGIKDFRVLDAMSQIPRHIFLDEALWSRAFEVHLFEPKMLPLHHLHLTLLDLENLYLQDYLEIYFYL